MLCAISGEAPQVPVASKKSGTVFEKRLIEAYISEHGTDPITNEELSADDLVELKASRTPRPRPPTLTSIPSLLSVFQNEWDALALETFTLRQQLQQARYELSTALYQNDAAVKMIASLSRERDEAREALSKIGVNGSAAEGGEDAMHLDGHGLTRQLIDKIESTQERLSKTRRKRTPPQDWTTAEKLQALKAQPLPGLSSTKSRSIALTADGNHLLVGGASGDAEIYSVSNGTSLKTLKGDGGPVTDAIWSGDRAIISSSTGSVRVFEDGSEIAMFSRHAGQVTALAVHPSGDILASVGVDKSILLYDLAESSVAMQMFTDSSLNAAAFHPDGHLFATGGADGKVKIFDVKAGTKAADYDCSGPIQSLNFSENGTWLAVAVQGETTVQIWDLRKSSQIKVLEIGAPVTSVKWEYTGQFLAAVGQSGIAIQSYSKATKEWTEVLRVGAPANLVEWGPKAESMILLGTDGAILTLA